MQQIPRVRGFLCNTIWGRFGATEGSVQHGSDEMGRPPMGSESRTVRVALRVTPVEEALLVERFGSSGKGLRALLDEHMQRGRYGARTGFPGEADLVQREQDMLTAFALDQVKQALPIGPEDLAEEGRRLASQREDLIAAGVDPAVLAVPLAPLPIGEHEPDEDLGYLTQDAPMLGTPLEEVVVDTGPLPGTIAAGVDSPDTGVVAVVAHRHRRGPVIATEFEKGTEVKVFGCVVDGCAVELR